MTEEGHQLSSQHGQQAQGNHHTGPTIVFFVFAGLLLGGLLKQLNMKTKIPYTPMLLVLGILFGYFRQSLGILDQFSDKMENIDPHMILLIFIPVLIFQSAFNCDWHVFRKSLVSILILAGPGVLWGAILIAVCFKNLLGYPDQQLTWYQALTLGCVLSATDPVAVVALLKQLGASAQFNTLVEGQSLLNDGTAMVFFMLFMDMAKGNVSSIGGVVSNFIRVSLGGPLLGVVVGMIISYWMKRSIRSSVVAINTTVVGAYLCFYVAQFSFLKVSGILSIVFLGLYMSAVGKRKIYPQSQHALHSVWSYIQYACQTLIFLITGGVAGVQMMAHDSTITGADWVRMIVFWILMIFCRAIMVFTCYPVLTMTGYGITKSQIVVLIYGGLRGALGLCLALMVNVDQQLPARFRQLTVFYMCGMVVLTILANGLTCRTVVDYVEMVSVPGIKKKLFKRCIKQVAENTKKKMIQLKKQPDLAYAKWNQVEILAYVKDTQVQQIELQAIQRAEQGNRMDSRKELFLEVQKSQILEQSRFRFIRAINKVYWELYENGQVSQQAIKTLSDTCDIINDHPERKMNYFGVLSRNFSMHTVRYYMYLRNLEFIGPFITRLLVSKIYFVYEVSSIFVEACEQALHAFHQDNILTVTQQFKIVMEEINENKQQAVRFVTELINDFPQVIQAVQTSRAASILLKNKRTKLTQLHQDGYVDKAQFEQLKMQIDIGLINIYDTEFDLEQIQFNNVFNDCHLFSSLNREEIIKIKIHSIEKQYEKGDIVVKKGQAMDYVYIIASGSVKQQFQDFYFIKGIRNVLNIYDFTYNQTSKCQIIANTTTKVMEVKPEVILQTLKRQPQFRRKWYKSMLNYSVKHEKSLSCIQQQLSEKDVRKFADDSEIRLMRAEQIQLLQYGGYVFEGQVQFQNNHYTKENLIPPESTVRALSDATLLKFYKPVGQLKAEKMQNQHEKV